jgi:hypothetical protein
MKRLTTETQRPRSETLREGIRSLWVLCASVVNFVPIRSFSDEASALRCGLLGRWRSRIYSCLFAVLAFYLRSSAVELFCGAWQEVMLCGSEFLP